MVVALKDFSQRRRVFDDYRLEPSQRMLNCAPATMEPKNLIKPTTGVGYFSNTYLQLSPRLESKS